ncbi:MAG: tetratricopeptide repeat protein [Planctomycetota bacterium]|nr:tetratricopeptide repeat protein [Planctomycetota bacterium]
MRCAVCNADNPNDAKFCCQCAARLAPAAPAPALTRAGAPPATPDTPPAAPGLRILATPEQRRVITVLFSDLKGLTRAAAGLDPEETAGLLRFACEKTAAIVESHGGLVDKYTGDTIMALFGIPQSHEDDAVRATRAALEMADTLGRLEASAVPGSGERSAPHHAPDAVARAAPVAPPATPSVRIGINTGEVFWTRLPDGSYTVMGDAVNLAQRLESIAQDGEILVAPRTFRLAEDFFVFRELSPTTVKGRSETVRPYRVIARRDTAKHFKTVAGLHTPMIGRDDELDRLEAAYSAMCDPASPAGPALAVVTGDAGMGKSRLVYEFMKRLDGHKKPPLVLRGRCVAYGESPYHPLREIMRRECRLDTAEDPQNEFFRQAEKVLARIESIAPLDRENYAHILGIALMGIDFPAARVKSLDAKAARELLHVAFKRWIEGMTLRAVPGPAAHSPVVIIIEDLHWADPSTQDLVGSLADTPPPGEWMLVAVGRTESKDCLRLGPQPASRGRLQWIEIPLKPLSRPELERLLSAAMAGPVDDTLLGFIIDHSGGNPYYAEEFVRFLIEKDMLARDERGRRRLKPGVDRVAVPDTLEGILGAGIDFLPQDTKELLSAASVVGRVFWRGAVERLLQRDVGAELRSLEHAELIVGHDTSDIPREEQYSFRHTLLREVFYGRLPKRLRPAFHAGVAEWIESRKPERRGAALLALAAHHHENAGSFDRAIYCWESAYREAKVRFAGSEIERYATRAIAAIEGRLAACAADAARTAELTAMKRAALEERGNTRTTFGKSDLARADFEAAFELADSPRTGARLLGRIAQTVHTSGDAQAADTLFQRAISLVPRGSGFAPERANLLLDYAWFLDDTRPRASDALRLTEEVMEIAREFDLPSLRADCLRTRGVMLQRVGSFDQAMDMLTDALSFYEKTGDRPGMGTTLGNIGVVCRQRGELDRAVEFHKKHLTIAEELGLKRGVATATGNLGLTYHDKGMFDEALECLKKDLAICEELGDKRGIGSVFCNMGLVYHDKGDFEKALQCHEVHLSVSEEFGDKRSAGIACGNISNTYALRGDFDSALEYQMRFLAASEEAGFKRGIANACGNIGEICLIRGELERALEFHRRQLTISEELGDKVGIALALEGIGNAHLERAETGIALEHYERSLSAAESAGFARATAVALGDIGRVHAKGGATALAEDFHRRALAMSEKIGFGDLAAGAQLALAEIELVKGCTESAAALVAEALARFKKMGMKMDEAVALAVSAVIETKAGRHGAASEYLARAEEVAGHIKGAARLERIAMARVRLLAAEGKRREAVEAARALVAELERIQPERILARREAEKLLE